MGKISYRVMKTGDFTDNNEPCVFYRVACSCGTEEHDTTFELEYDGDNVTFTAYQKLLWSSFWGLPNIVVEMWNRVKYALKILFTGYVEVEGSTILEGEEHIQGFIDALEEGKDKVKESYKGV